LVEQVNVLVHTYLPEHPSLSPDLGNVLFASPEQGYCFSLESFAAMYIEYFWDAPRKGKKGPSAQHPEKRKELEFTPKEFSKRLWGDLFYHQDSHRFSRKLVEGEDGSSRLLRQSKRSFVEFILEPLYKIYSHVVGEEREGLEPLMKQLGIFLTPSEYISDVRYLLRSIFSQLFGKATAFTDMVVRFLPSPIEGAPTKIKHTYTGPVRPSLYKAVCEGKKKGTMEEEDDDDDEDLSAEERLEATIAFRFSQSLLTCSAQGPLSMNVVKMIPKANASGFDVLARVLSGRIKEGMAVRVLGETYSEYDQEASALETLHKVWLPQARYRVGLSSAVAGSWVLIEGIETSIIKTATVVNEDETIPSSSLFIYRPLNFCTQSIVKIAVEPLNPSELPKMIDGLRKINSSYPLAITKKEENGEHIILGTGELYLDCIMRDLRTMFCDIEIKVSDPVVSFCETVAETSSFKCFASTLNQQNRLTIIAEPLERGLGEEIEAKKVCLSWEPRKVADFFRTKYNYDSLAARSVWAFGPTEQGANILIDDTLPTEVDKGTLTTIKRFIIQGFQWGTREGPLCEEPIRNVKFKLLDAVMAKDEVGRSGAQLIPTARRVCYTALLMAKPCLMEPYLYVECYCPDKFVSEVEKVIKGGSVSGFRRGYIDRADPIPGTPLVRCRCYIPAIDSFGLETNIRQWTLGQAFCVSLFDHWELGILLFSGAFCITSFYFQSLEILSTAVLSCFLSSQRRTTNLRANLW
jgi:U5 small nuclear ribonucleoprotein component